MIEVLGQSPISSVMTAGRSEFMSIFRNRVSKALSQDPNRYPRPYTATRGVLINKEYVLGSGDPDLSKGYKFQFNPQTISDVKSTLYEARQYAGMPYNDYVWGGGGERIISFHLFLDNTPQSKQRSFRPTEYGSKVADEFKTEGTGYTYDEDTGKYTLNKNYIGKGLVDELKSVGKSLKESVIPSKGPSSYSVSAGTMVSNGAYSMSRVDERGVLPEVEKIQSFLYPAPKGNEATPKFAEGGVVKLRQFRPPATAVLAIGPLYLEGVVKSAPVQYTLFDQDLTPIRATIDLEFAVFEFAEVNRKIKWER